MRQPDTAHLSVPDADAMRAAGGALGEALRAGAAAARVVTLQGDLGAGKTTLVSGILRELGVQGAIRSPTYTLIEPYDTTALQVYHLDLYRLVDASEVEALGIRDLLEVRAVLLVEWPERGAGALPEADLAVRIDYAASPAAGRSVALQAHSAAGVDALQRFLAAIR